MLLGEWDCELGQAGRLGRGRKLIMIIVALIAIYFLIQSAYISMIIALILLCMFSPRIVGEVAVIIGNMKNGK